MALAAVAMSGTVWGAPGPADSVLVQTNAGRTASTGVVEVPRFSGNETEAWPVTIRDERDKASLR